MKIGFSARFYFPQISILFFALSIFFFFLHIFGKQGGRGGGQQLGILSDECALRIINGSAKFKSFKNAKFEI